MRSWPQKKFVDESREDDGGYAGESVGMAERREDESENPECEPADGPKRNETTMGGKGDGEGEPVSIECECRARVRKCSGANAETHL